jgi:hypothetical protein
MKNQFSRKSCQHGKIPRKTTIPECRATPIRALAARQATKPTDVGCEKFRENRHFRPQNVSRFPAAEIGVQESSETGKRINL